MKKLSTCVALVRRLPLGVAAQYEEQLEDCRKYREFLDSITPLEFFEAQANKLQQRKDAMLAEWQVRAAGWHCQGGVNTLVLHRVAGAERGACALWVVHTLQAECEAVRKRKEAAMAAKAKADHDYANARTQQVRGCACFRQQEMLGALASPAITCWRVPHAWAVVAAGGGAGGARHQGGVGALERGGQGEGAPAAQPRL